MKLFQPFKAIFLISLALLYVTGLFVYVMSGWFRIDQGMGLEPHPLQLTSLHLHSILGLFFLVCFGYLWATQILPGWRRRQKRRTGGAMTAICILLIVTVPFLFYAMHEDIKTVAVWIHTYMGLLAVVPLIVHMTTHPK